MKQYKKRESLEGYDDALSRGFRLAGTSTLSLVF